MIADESNAPYVEHCRTASERASFRRYRIEVFAAMMIALVRFVVSAAIAALTEALVTTTLGQLERAGVPQVGVIFPFVRRRFV